MYLGDSTRSLVDGTGERASFNKNDRGAGDIPGNAQATRVRRVQQSSPQATKPQQGIQITPGMVTTSLLLAAFGFPLAAPLAGLIPGLRKGSDAFGNTVNSGLKSTFGFFKDTFKSILGKEEYQAAKKYVRQVDQNFSQSASTNQRPRIVENTRPRIFDQQAFDANREPKGFFGTVGSGIRDFGNTVFDTIGSGLSSVGSAIGSGVKSIGSAVGGFFGKLFGGGSDKAQAVS